MGGLDDADDEETKLATDNGEEESEYGKNRCPRVALLNTGPGAPVLLSAAVLDAASMA